MPREGDRPLPVGKARSDRAWVSLQFDAGALGKLGKDLRPFLFLTDRQLAEWPAVPPEAVQAEPEAAIWAAPAGTQPDKRPVAWRGWLLAPDLALLRPEVALDALVGLDRRQDGFLTRKARWSEARDADGRSESGDGGGGPAVPEDENLDGEPGGGVGGDVLPQRTGRDGVPDLVAETPARPVQRAGRRRRKRGDPSAPQLSLGLEAPPPDAPAEPDRWWEGHEVSPDGFLLMPGPKGTIKVRQWPRHAGPILPPSMGPTPERIRIRMRGSGGLRPLSAGMELDAERCPEMTGSAWVRLANGYSYRIPEEAFEVLQKRRKGRNIGDL
jgi:hypothetical protein